MSGAIRIEGDWTAAQLRRLAAAQQSLEESAQNARALLATQPTDALTSVTLGIGLSRLAATVAAQGDSARARALFDESTPLLQSVTSRVQSFETELAEHYTRMAAAGMGAWAQAAAQWRGIRDAGSLSPLDLPELEEAERRAAQEQR